MSSPFIYSYSFGGREECSPSGESLAISATDFTWKQIDHIGHAQFCVRIASAKEQNLQLGRLESATRIKRTEFIGLFCILVPQFFVFRMSKHSSVMLLFYSKDFVLSRPMSRCSSLVPSFLRTSDPESGMFSGVAPAQDRVGHKLLASERCHPSSRCPRYRSRYFEPSLP